MAETIIVLVERCTMEIILEPFFTNTTLTKQKQLLRYVFQEPWRNTETINILTAFLDRKQAEAKENWSKASKTFQDEYTATQFHYELSTQERKRCEYNNSKLLARVKSSKKQHEKWEKIILFLEMLKNKNGISTTLSENKVTNKIKE